MEEIDQVKGDLIYWHCTEELKMHFVKVLPSPTSAGNKRKAEETKGKGSAKKPSAGAAKKGVFKR